MVTLKNLRRVTRLCLSGSTRTGTGLLVPIGRSTSNMGRKTWPIRSLKFSSRSRRPKIKRRRASSGARLLTFNFFLRFWGEFCHQISNTLELQPPLFARSLIVQIGHAVEVTHIMKSKFSVLQADETAGSIPLLALLDQMRNAECCQARRLDAVKWGWITALLQMSQDGRTYIEHILALLFEKRTDKTCGIDWVGSFIADDKSKFFTRIETILECIYIFLQLTEGDSIFRQIEVLCAGRECAHQSKITAPVSHYFNHKTASCGNRRLLDLVHGINNIIQCRIRSDTEFRTRQIVVNGSRQADDGNVKCWEVSAFINHGMDTFIGIPAADHKQRFDLMILNGPGNGIHILAFGHLTACAQHGAARGNPTANTGPHHFLYFHFGYTFKADIHAQHDM